MKTKKNLFLILILLLIIGCKTQNYQLGISTINKFEHLYTKEDEIYLEKMQNKSKKFADSCEKFNLDCLLHSTENEPQFSGGISRFRELVYKNIDQTKFEKPSKSTIQFTVGKNDSIETIDVLSENTEMKKEIFRVMNIESIKKQWQSGKIASKKVTYLFEFDIKFFVKK